jgi:hypothetical protein
VRDFLVPAPSEDIAIGLAQAEVVLSVVAPFAKARFVPFSFP